jgi:hypothetical protein
MNEIGIDTDDNSVSLIKEGDERKVFVVDVLGGKYQMGGEYDKRKVEAVVDPNDEKRSERKLRLVLKEATLLHKDDFLLENPQASLAERYYGKWKLLRDAGIPTASSMRIVDDKTVAMGDMTWDGSKFFGKEKYIEVLEGRDTNVRELTAIEKVFLSINPQKIKQEIERVQKLAWEKGIMLPGDDPYDLLVHLDGTWQILVLDISELRPRRKSDRIEDLEAEKEEMWEDVDIIRTHLIKLKNENERA